MILTTILSFLSGNNIYCIWVRLRQELFSERHSYAVKLQCSILVFAEKYKYLSNYFDQLMWFFWNEHKQLKYDAKCTICVLYSKLLLNLDSQNVSRGLQRKICLLSTRRGILFKLQICKTVGNFCVYTTQRVG